MDFYNVTVYDYMNDLSSVIADPWAGTRPQGVRRCNFSFILVDKKLNVHECFG